MKKDTESLIFPYIQSLGRHSGRVSVYFIWHERTYRRDPDNICFAKKFILDAMVTAGKIEGDSAKFIKGLKDGFSFGEKDGVEVYIKGE